MSPRAIYYGRFSGLKQSETLIEVQFAQLDAHSNCERWTPTRRLEDRAIPGASVARRPQYQAFLQAIRNRECDIVLAEALDRLSRDQEDTAALYKICAFNNVRLFTLKEGEITPLHVGLKGTMNALYLEDLALKTKRGLKGRVDKGASAGGLSYGYGVVLSDNERGQRTINGYKKEVIVRIFKRYADGQSPRQIAYDLNADGIPGPRGALWTQSTINGNRARGTGILNNEVYRGLMVWNRLRYKRDPDTGRRRSEPNVEADIKRTSVPHLRIVSDELSDAVRQRQAKLDIAAKPAADGQTFQSKQRPKYLLSGLVTYGACGSGMSMISRTNLGCSAAQQGRHRLRQLPHDRARASSPRSSMPCVDASWRRTSTSLRARLRRGMEPRAGQPLKRAGWPAGRTGEDRPQDRQPRQRHCRQRRVRHAAWRLERS